MRCHLTLPCYFIGRKQHVCICGTPSNYAPLNCEVPDGSALGLLLLLILINGIISNIPAKTCLYAYDYEIISSNDYTAFHNSHDIIFN